MLFKKVFLGLLPFDIHFIRFIEHPVRYSIADHFFCRIPVYGIPHVHCAKAGIFQGSLLEYFCGGRMMGIEAIESGLGQCRICDQQREQEKEAFFHLGKIIKKNVDLGDPEMNSG